MEETMQGRASIIIAHRLITIIDVDRIYVMKEGEVVEQGSLEALMADEGLYHRQASLGRLLE